MRKTLRVAALVLALCVPVFAGHIGTPPVVTPPPTSAVRQQTEPGTIHTGVTASIVKIVLDLLTLL